MSSVVDGKITGQYFVADLSDALTAENAAIAAGSQAPGPARANPTLPVRVIWQSESRSQQAPAKLLGRGPRARAVFLSCAQHGRGLTG
jgi:hypothetical protein